MRKLKHFCALFDHFYHSRRHKNCNDRTLANLGAFYLFLHFIDLTLNSKHEQDSCNLEFIKSTKIQHFNYYFYSNTFCRRNWDIVLARLRCRYDTFKFSYGNMVLCFRYHSCPNYCGYRYLSSYYV